MAAKGRKKTTKVVKKVEPEPEPESEPSDEEVDLETMERMLKDSDSEEEASDQELVEEEASEEEESDDDAVLEEESDDDDDDDDDDDVVEEEEAEESSEGEEMEVDIRKGGDEKINIDLRNLLAFNSHQVNHQALYQKQSKNIDDQTTICAEGAKIANEDHLLEKAAEGCAQLLTGLWKLETEKTDAGPMATLPSYFETVTPRELVS